MTWSKIKCGAKLIFEILLSNVLILNVDWYGLELIHARILLVAIVLLASSTLQKEPLSDIVFREWEIK